VLSLQKCRSLLGTDCKLTDSQVEQLRQEIYALSDVVIESFCAQKVYGAGSSAESQNVSGCLSGIPHPEREVVEERAAILEFEGCLKKSEAERQAFGEWAQSKTTSRKGRRKLEESWKTLGTGPQAFGECATSKSTTKKRLRESPGKPDSR
jgi:hypothetical protein